MNRFYKATINKIPIGTAIQHQEPPIQGKLVVKVVDTSTAGDFMVMVVNAGDKQHKANLALPAIESLTEAQAVKLAKKYQPKRTMTDINPRTMAEEETTFPACDLKKYYQKKTK
jgi:hypothetical protein